MTPERWQQVEEVLQAALDRPPHERSSFLNEACSGDERLRQEASSLIDAYDEAGDFIEEPAIAHDAHVLLGNNGQDNIGREIGPYQIIERLGAGGMGEVYLAEDRRLARQVALKILPPYFVSDEARLRRFQREARAASALKLKFRSSARPTCGPVALRNVPSSVAMCSTISLVTFWSVVPGPPPKPEKCTCAGSPG